MSLKKKVWWCLIELTGFLETTVFFIWLDRIETTYLSMPVFHAQAIIILVAVSTGIMSAVPLKLPNIFLSKPFPICRKIEKKRFKQHSLFTWACYRIYSLAKI